MPSPFPGFDPFIEAQDRWHSFHTAFIAVCCESLNERLPENYYATVEERVLLDASDPQEPEARKIFHRVGPDAAIQRSSTEFDDAGSASAESTHSINTGQAEIATLAPRTLPQSVVTLDQPTQKLIEVRGLPNHELVTTIELLSPSNKRAGDDRTAYLAKRVDLLRHGVNTVDIDVLLNGQRLPLLVPLPTGDFHAFVTRAVSNRDCLVYSWSVRDTLPTILIPLKENAAEVSLNLQAIFTRVYDRNRYPIQLRYDRPIPSALSQADREWVAALLQSFSR
jgi:hypothetical protein